MSLTPDEQIAKTQAQNIETQDSGHSLARHGPEIPDGDLEKRITTGITPDSTFSPTSASTRFSSYQIWLQTRQAALLAFSQREGIDLSQPPPPNFSPIPPPIVIEHGYPVDDGFIGSGGKILVTDALTGKRGRVYTNTSPVKGLTRTHTQIKWNVSTNSWEVQQHYPDATNWDQTTDSYTAPP
jgi:hypothetical protein